MTPEQRAKQLVDQIVNLAFNQMAPEIQTLVGHMWPDTDAWLCLWIARKFIPRTANAEIVFVNAGESLSGFEDDPSVLHFDTGGGPFDQHGKGLKRTSSAMLLACHLKIQNDPGLKALLNLTVMVDNVEKLSPTNLHYIIEGLPRIHRGTDNLPDWAAVQKTVFDMFSIVYGQETGRQRSRNDLENHAGFYTLPNGIRFTELSGHPGLRAAAFERGADVVLWTQPKKRGFYVGVQVNRRSKVVLTGVAENLRRAEAAARELAVEDQNFNYIGREENGNPVRNWFLHDSLKLVLCGSRTWELTDEEFTRLNVRQICETVRQALEKISEQAVRGQG